jgi:hypothetical protein
LNEIFPLHRQAHIHSFAPDGIDNHVTAPAFSDHDDVTVFGSRLADV